MVSFFIDANFLQTFLMISCHTRALSLAKLLPTTRTFGDIIRYINTKFML